MDAVKSSSNKQDVLWMCFDSQFRSRSVMVFVVDSCSFFMEHNSTTPNPSLGESEKEAKRFRRLRRHTSTDHTRC